MTAPTHVLAVQVGALSLLDDAMGAAVMDSALAELDRRLPPLFAEVLARQDGPRALPGARRGRWGVGFRLAPSPLGESPDEALAVVETATRHLLRETVNDVLGAATGGTAAMVVQAAPVPVGATPCGPWLDALLSSERQRLPEMERLRGELRTIMDGDGIRTLMQPIVAFDDGRLLGFEALSRGPAGHTLERADRLFDAAARTGLTLDLERACALRAADWAADLPPHLFLTVNVSAPLIADEAVRAALGRPGIVTEITEHLPLNRASEILPALAALRAAGGRVALDDTGCGFADTEAAEVLRPEVVKLCITVIRSARRSPDVLPELRATIERFRALGAQVLAEGVETEDERTALSGLGIALAQGWLFGKPVPADQWRQFA